MCARAHARARARAQDMYMCHWKCRNRNPHVGLYVWSVWLLTCDRAYTQCEYWWRPWVHCGAHDWITHTLHMSYVHTNDFASIMGKWFVTVPDAQPSLLAALDVRLLVLVFSLTCGSSYLHSFFWHLGTFSVISGSTWSRRLKVIVEPIMQDIQVVIHSQWHLTQLQWRGSEVDDRGNGKDSGNGLVTESLLFMTC